MSSNLFCKQLSLEGIELSVALILCGWRVHNGRGRLNHSFSGVRYEINPELVFMGLLKIQYLAHNLVSRAFNSEFK